MQATSTPRASRSSLRGRSTDQTDETGETGAVLIEYALVVSLILLALIALLPWFQQQIATLLIDTGDDIGQARSVPDPAFVPGAVTPPNWVSFNPAFGPNLVVNGSFEDPDLAGCGCFWQGPMPGWTTTDNSSGPNTTELWDNGTVAPAFDGDQFMELNVESNAEHTQVVNVNPGTLYVWSFVHRARMQNGESLEVLIDGNVVATTVANVTNWQRHEGQHVATGGTITFTLRPIATTVVNFYEGNLIDAVSIREYSL